MTNCTCNGKDAFGLAKIDVASDPTLKPGDIVATGDNQKAALIAAASERARCANTVHAPTPRCMPRQSGETRRSGQQKNEPED